MTDASSRLPRQLAAILYADVVGFSRMTEQDEEATYRSVRGRLDRFADAIKAHGGDVMNYAGDAVLARFRSAEDSLLCAARVQQEFAELNRSLPDNQKIVFRIGLNLGDIIEDRGDMFGNGVNVAARLESLAKPGGICVSGTFHDAIAGKLPFEFEDMGEQRVKNISKPVRAYDAAPAQGAVLPSIGGASARRSLSPVTYRVGAALAIIVVLALATVFWSTANRQGPAGGKPEPGTRPATAAPALVVLPFVNLSKDPAQEYFSDGITDDLINELSSYTNLFVIARRSAYMYKTRAQSMQTIARELQADYIVDGSVRRYGNRIRVNVQLVNAAEGRNVWAQQFNKEATDIFKVQDEIRGSIIKALDVVLTKEERERARRQYTNSFEAYDLFLQGQSKLVTRASAEDNHEAQALLKQAIELDPGFARAYAALALSHADAFRFDWSDNPEQTRQTALALAKRAAELDSNSPQAYWVLGYIYLFLFEQHDKAIVAASRSLALAPYNSDATTVLAVTYVFGDDPKKALSMMEEVMRRNQHYPSQVPSIVGWAYLRLGEYQRALEAFNKSLLINPSRVQALAPKAVALYRMGKQEDAEFQVYELYAQHPDFDVDVWAARLALKDKRFGEGLKQDLIKAGVKPVKKGVSTL